MPTYLYIANDKWFDFQQLMKDKKGNIHWFHSPKRVAKGDQIYLYLSGGTKAIKYEFVVKETGLLAKDTIFNNKSGYDKYLLVAKEKHKKDNDLTPVVLLSLVREIESIDKTTPKRMKEDGKIFGMLMSNRELKPFSIEWIDGIK